MVVCVCVHINGTTSRGAGRKSHGQDSDGFGTVSIYNMVYRQGDLYWAKEMGAKDREASFPCTSSSAPHCVTRCLTRRIKNVRTKVKQDVEFSTPSTPSQSVSHRRKNPTETEVRSSLRYRRTYLRRKLILLAPSALYKFILPPMS